MAPHDGSSAPEAAAELRHTVLHLNGERDGYPTPPPSHSGSSGSLSAQDGTLASDRALGKGLSGLKKRVLSRLNLSDPQLAKDVVSAQPGMRVALDGLSYTVRNYCIPATFAGQDQPLHAHGVTAGWRLTHRFM